MPPEEAYPALGPSEENHILGLSQVKPLPLPQAGCFMGSIAVGAQLQAKTPAPHCIRTYRHTNRHRGKYTQVHRDTPLTPMHAHTDARNHTPTHKDR